MKIECIGYKRLNKPKLRGVCDLKIDDSLIIRDCTHVQRDGVFTVGLPYKQYGAMVTQVVEFVSEADLKTFEIEGMKAVLDYIDRNKAAIDGKDVA